MILAEEVAARGFARRRPEETRRLIPVTDAALADFGHQRLEAGIDIFHPTLAAPGPYSFDAISRPSFFIEASASVRSPRPRSVSIW